MRGSQTHLFQILIYSTRLFEEYISFIFHSFLMRDVFRNSKYQLLILDGLSRSRQPDDFSGLMDIPIFKIK